MVLKKGDLIKKQWFKGESYILWKKDSKDAKI